MLVSQLNNTFGVTGSALDWIRSYLDDRSTFVCWKQISSDVFPLDTGVPQRSSLGPLLFSLYDAPLSAIINSFGVSYQQYTDDANLHQSIESWGLRLSWPAIGLHCWCSLVAIDVRSSTQFDQIGSNTVHGHQGAWQSRWRHFRPCVESCH